MIYLGFYKYDRKHFKIGETSQQQHKREKQISRFAKKDFYIVSTYKLNTDNKVTRLLIESLVRYQLAKKYKHFGNDHFQRNKATQNEIKADFENAIKKATAIVEILNSDNP